VAFIEDEGGARKRTFQSTGALYNGGSRILT